MTFARTETQIMLADMVDRLLADRNAFEDRRVRLAAANPDRMALWPELAQLGVIGALFNEDAGGFGGSARDLATIMEAAGRYLVVEPLLATAITGMLLHAAGENVAELIAGSHTIAFAHDEGLDPFAARRSTAVREGEQWRITGTKPAVRHADFADRVLATADVEGGTRCFLLEIDRDEALESIRLMDASSAATLRLEGKSARLLDLPEAVLDLALARAAVGLAAETVGILEALCDKSFAYLNTRKQFGTTLASFQALRHRAADMVAAAEEARALTDRAIDALDHGSLALASAAKALADEAGRLIGHEAVQLHGGMGVSDELDISHYLRRLATIRATLGQSACHRARFLALGGAAIAADQDGALEEFRSEIRQFVRDELPEDIAAKGRAGLEFDKADFVRWQKLLLAKNWFAAAWPEEHGGAGWDLERQLAFVQEAGSAGAPLIIPYGVNMVGPVLYTFGTVEQRARHLPAILSSDVWWCQGYSEPNAGSDLASLKTTAVRDGDEYIVNGTKMWTTEAHWADWMHCLVRTGREGKAQAGISFLLIDMTTPGIDIRPIVTIDGQHHTNQIFFDDVRVPAANLVGDEGQGWAIAKFLLANERVAIADTGPKLKLLADIKALFAQICAEEGDTAVTALLADRLGDAEVQLAALCAMEQDFVRKWASGASREGLQASILKVRGTEILQLLSEIALEIEGPYGAVHDPADLHLPPTTDFTPAQRASIMAHQYLYGRCWSIFGGTNEIQRELIARAALG